MICECTTGQKFRHTFTCNLFKSLNLSMLLERYWRHEMHVRLQQTKMFSNSIKKKLQCMLVILKNLKKK